MTIRFCDLRCPEARFPEDEGVDGAGSCRTFAALHCRKLGRLVHKNMPCPAPDEPLENEAPKNQD
jgi:hypothetical protein